MNLGDQRAHVGAARAVTGTELGHALGDLCDQWISNITNGDECRDRHAALASGAEAGVNSGVCSEVEISIRKDDHVVLGTAESLDALTVRGTRLVYVLGNWRRTNERDALDVWVRQQRINSDLVTMNNVENAVR